MSAVESDRAVRPSSLFLKRRSKRVQPVGVDMLAERWAKGLDLWTGKPLTGAALFEWKNLHKEL